VFAIIRITTRSLPHLMRGSFWLMIINTSTIILKWHLRKWISTTRPTLCV